METALYQEMADLEEDHWWFVGRRVVILDTLKRFLGDKRGEILDVGIGTGINAAAFIKTGFKVTGVESSPEAIRFSRQKAPAAQIIESHFPTPLITPASYDIVTALDVVEHFEDDTSALKDMARVLRPGGYIFITVPAFSFLWSPHDELAHHYRRYRRRELKHKLKEAGLEPVFISYYNFWLFPPIALVRLVSNVLGRTSGESDFSRTPAFLNNIFALLFASEKYLLRFTQLPFGVSLIAVAQKLK